MTSVAARNQAGLKSRIAGQGALLFAGFATAQALSFARNAILAHWLAKGDFGIAAAILLLLQMVETLSDIGADRLIVQASDGDEPRFAATAHLTLVVRGFATFLAIAAASVPLASFFDVPHAAWAFAAAGFAPFVKGFLHLDARRAQRRLDNRPQMMIELAPQVVALALTIPVIELSRGYAAVVWLSLAQALVAVAVSHLLAERRYALALEPAYLSRLVTFGWPIWVSAFPLVAVYQGDRLVIGHVLGMEQLATYTAAFMVTMVPGVLAAKVANALMLPLLASTVGDRERFTQRFVVMAELTAAASAAYAAVFAIAGGTMISLAFGPAYTGLDTIVTILAAMWAMRMMQATLGVALMAKGETRPFLVAGLVRAFGVPMALAALLAGYGLAGAALAGAAAELLSLVYVGWRLERLARDMAEHGDEGTARLGAAGLWRALALLPALLVAWPLARLVGDTGRVMQILAGMASAAVILFAVLAVMPSTARALSEAFATRRNAASTL